MVSTYKVLIFLVILSFWGKLFGKTLEILTGEYPPFVGANLPHHGATSHVVQEAFKIMGYKVKFLYRPWKRAHYSVEIGRYIATSYWQCTPERKKNFYCGGYPVMIENFTFFYNKKNPIPNWSTLDDLKTYKFGLTLEYSYTKELLDKIKSDELNGEFVSKDQHNLRKLLVRRIDLFPVNDAVGYALIRKHFSPEKQETFATLPKKLVEIPAYLLISRKHPEGKKFFDIFQKGMSKIVASGLRNKIWDDLKKGAYDLK